MVKPEDRFIVMIASSSYFVRQVLRGLACGVLLLLCLAPAHAEKADKDKPLNLEADSVSYDDVKQVMVVQGRVLVTKGTLMIRASRMEQREDPEGYVYMQATAKRGERVFFRQKREGVDEYMEGEADQVDFDGKADTVKLTGITGKAVMRRLRGAVLADESIGAVIVFNNTTQTMTLSGKSPAAATSAGATQSASDSQQERVRMMLSPKTESLKQATSAGNASPRLRPTPEIGTTAPPQR